MRWVALCAAIIISVHAEVRASGRASPDFARNIFPILRRHCFECHGPKKQEGDLRLDERQPAFAHETASVPGNSTASEIYRRMTLSPGDDEFMPAVGKPLTRSEIELLRRWIDA